MPILFGPGGIFDQGFDLGPFVTGTNGTDYFSLNHDYTTTVNLLGGNDRLWLYGHGDYEVDLGSGHDHVYIRGSGNVEVDAGSGLDRVYVEEMRCQSDKRFRPWSRSSAGHCTSAIARQWRPV